MVEQKITVGACDRAAELTQAQVRKFKPRTDVVADLQDLFGDEVLALKMTSMADSMHALSCHNMTLPCSDKVRELLPPCIGDRRGVSWSGLGVPGVVREYLTGTPVHSYRAQAAVRRAASRACVVGMKTVVAAVRGRGFLCLRWQ